MKHKAQALHPKIRSFSPLCHLDLSQAPLLGPGWARFDRKQGRRCPQVPENLYDLVGYRRLFRLITSRIFLRRSKAARRARRKCFWAFRSCFLSTSWPQRACNMAISYAESHLSSLISAHFRPFRCFRGARGRPRFCQISSQAWQERSQRWVTSSKVELGPPGWSDSPRESRFHHVHLFFLLRNP